jgi:hypothetical protein
MKTIEEAAKSHEFNREKNSNSSLINKNTIISFKAGAEFVQRWISVEDEELPPLNEEFYIIVKKRLSLMLVKKFISVGIAREVNYGNGIKISDLRYLAGKVTHWRPIEIK